MSLDSETSVIEKFGTVKVMPGHIEVVGFDGRNCSCRDVAVQACLWAIGEL